jgi:HK97 family phage portal protein
MGILARLLRPQALDALDDRWYTSAPYAATAYSGVSVTAGTALMSSAVWSCVRLIAESVATMPIILYRRQSDGGKRRAPEHPLYDLLHDDPNELQSAFTWKRFMMVQALLYGNAYSRIVPGARGAVDRLEPIHAEMMRIEYLADGGIRYMERNPTTGQEQAVNVEDIFHLPGLSLDGIGGLSLVQYARESIGLALAAEGYSAKFYSQGAQPGGVLKTPGKLSPTGYDRLKQSWQDHHAGPANWHKPAILEEGVEWVQMGMTHQDAELIAQLDWSAGDIARFFNVPLHMIQLMTKSTSWGSGIEEMGIQFVTFTLLPWVKNWEQLITKKLIVARQAYFAEFLLDSLMRGKLTERYQAYGMGRQWGWLSVNDVRRLENMNPIEDGDGYMMPLNMTELGTPPPEPAPAPQPPQQRERVSGHYHLLLHEAACRVVRKEIAALGKAAKRCEDDAAWCEAVAEFYADHAAFVAATLRICHADAQRYVDEQQAALIERGAAAMDDWETARVGDLIALAMGGDDVRAGD